MSEKSTDKESSGGKWAAEVYDFLRIFRRLNGTLYGLLLIEIGWVLLLILIGKLTPTGSTTPQTATITLSWPTFQEFRVVDLYLPGAILLIIAWVFWSGLINYLWYFVRFVVGQLLFLLFIFLGLIAPLANLFLLWLTWPLEYIMATRFIKKLNPEEKAEKSKTLTEDLVQQLRSFANDPEKHWGDVATKIGWRNADLFYKKNRSDKENSDLQRNIERAASYGYAVEQVGFERWILIVPAWKFLANNLRPLRTRTFIGFAPIQSYNYEEDLMAAKAPAQAVSSAIDHIRWKLSQLKFLQYLRFNILPDHIKPRNTSEASFLRKALGFDVLLWGSYINDQPNKIWLNIDRTFENPSKNNSNGLDSVFPSPLNIYYSKMIVDQTIFLDTYAALLIALVQTLRPRAGSSNKRILGKYIDELYYGSNELEMVIEHLVFDIFPKINLATGVEQLETEFSSIPKIIVEITGNWIGYKVKRASFNFDSEQEFIL